MHISNGAHSHPSVRKPSRSVDQRRVTVALASFSALSALAGGFALLLTPNGGAAPLSLLEHSPFTSFLIPGLILAFVVGGTSAGCALLTLQRSRLATDATILAGGTLLVWILVEVSLMRMVQWLHWLCGFLGAALLVLGIVSAWRTRERRHRWIVTVTIAEALGFLAPVCVGVFSAAYHASDLQQGVLVVAAGAVEGFALGLGQAIALPLPIRKMRYALLTSLGAAIVWASVMFMTSLFGHGHSPLLLALLCTITGAVGLLAMGTMQWIELRHSAPRAHRWIFWTALAWCVALPLSFTPAPLVDMSTPVASNLVIWACGGLLMAFVMASISWLGVRRIFLRPATVS
ncbi:MAG: hypothetical protein IPK60_10125 [Sandaracinaceae bacterium]|nr:hypothetical protein [Sandaracinaceae bacterium]